MFCRKRSRSFELTLVAMVSLLTVPIVAAIPPGPDDGGWALADAVHRPNEEGVRVGYTCLVGNDHPLCPKIYPDFGAQVALDEDTMVVGEPNADSLHIFRSTASGWEWMATHGGPKDFGRAIAIDGGTIVAGSQRSSEARLFTFEEGSWTLTTTLSPEGSACFGNSVDVRAGLLAVGDPCASKVHVFDVTAPHPEPMAVLEAQGAVSLGGNLALSGDSLVASASSGRLYVFDQVDDEWVPELVATVMHGGRISADGNRFAISADNGVAVFENSDEGWQRVTTLYPVDESPFTEYDEFGASLAIRQDTLVVGAPLVDAFPPVENEIPDQERECYALRICLPIRTGAAYVFEWTGEGWVQTVKLTPELAYENKVGEGVALNDDATRLLLGAPLQERRISTLELDPVDSVYIYERRVP